LGRKINLSGISLAKRSRPGPNSVYMYMDMSRGDNVRVIFGRNRPILGKMGRWDESRGASFFCGKPDDFSTTSQWSISTKFGRDTYFGVPSQNPEKHLRNFYFRGHLPPKSKIGQTGTSLRAGYRSRDALQGDTVYSTL